MDGDEIPEGEEEIQPELDTEAEEEVTEGDGEFEEGETEGGDQDGDLAVSGEGKEPTRRTLRVQKLERERDERAAEAADYKRKYDELLSAQHTQRTPQQQQIDDAAEQAKISAMDPADRVGYLANKEISALRSEIRGLGFQTQDSADRSAFEARASIDPLYEKYKDRVEESLTSMRAKGANTTREAILTYLIGDDARKRATQKPDGQRRRAAATSRVENSKGRPVTVRSDAANSKAEKSVEDRLRGVQI